MEAVVLMADVVAKREFAIAKRANAIAVPMGPGDAQLTVVTTKQLLRLD